MTTYFFVLFAFFSLLTLNVLDSLDFLGVPSTHSLTWNCDYSSVCTFRVYVSPLSLLLAFRRTGLACCGYSKP